MRKISYKNGRALNIVGEQNQIRNYIKNNERKTYVGKNLAPKKDTPSKRRSFYLGSSRQQTAKPEHKNIKKILTKMLHNHNRISLLHQA